MKKLSLMIALLLSGAGYCKEIPSPFWYSLSEKILAGTNQLISTEHNSAKSVITIKVKPVKTAKPATTTLKCQPKKENIQLNPFITISTEGMWIHAE
ncbi:MAG TPA: hypothetical protein VK623_04495 [Flavobacterium sp.]|nr:hypothetical protein [Flavobacterium sp.]